MWLCENVCTSHLLCPCMCGRRCHQKSDNLCPSGTLKNPICVHQRLAPAGVSLSQTLNSYLDTYWKSSSWIPKHVFPQSTSLPSLIVSAESDCVLSGEQHLLQEHVGTTCLMIWRLFEVQQFVSLDGLKMFSRTQIWQIYNWAVYKHRKKKADVADERLR